jgi:hypothetical protein
MRRVRKLLVTLLVMAQPISLFFLTTENQSLEILGSFLFVGKKVKPVLWLPGLWID